MSAEVGHLKEYYYFLHLLLAGCCFICPVSMISSLSDQTWRKEAEHSCSSQLFDLSNDLITVENPPNVFGLWISEKCEIRPGPEFVLRKYRFDTSGHFVVNQFYYADADCHEPIFYVEASGSFKQHQQSWIAHGAYEVDYSLNEMTVIPYTEDVARSLETVVNKTCRDLAARTPWQAGQRYTVEWSAAKGNNDSLSYYDYIDVQDDVSNDDGLMITEENCMTALGFSLHELQLMKVVEGYSRDGSIKKLYLGDIHVDRQQRAIYRPTNFQEPLMSAKTYKCLLCSSVIASTETEPPIFRLQPVSNSVQELHGNWVSYECEHHSNGKYVLRHLIFSDSKQFESYSQYFNDQFCRVPQFSIILFGRYRTKGPLSLMKNALEVEMRIDKANLTVTDSELIKTVRGDAHCGAGKRWETHRPVDILSTNGCRNLGITVSSRSVSKILLLTKPYGQHGQSFLHIGEGLVTNNTSARWSTSAHFSFALRYCSGKADHFRKSLHQQQRANKASCLKCRPTAIFKFLYILLSLWQSRRLIDK